MAPPSRRTVLGGVAATGAARALSPVAAIAAKGATKYRVAAIGHTGRGDFGHGLDKVWLSVPGAEIVAVADPVEGGREKKREQLGLEANQGWADYRAMLAEAKPDIVAVCPRHIDQHRDMAVACAEAGVKGIYIEKPFCRNLAEANDIVSACEANGTRLAIAHRNRYHPVLPVVKRLVADGEIGEWLEIRARGKEDARGGALDLWVLGSHLLNLAHFFAGDPVDCTATLLQDGRPVIGSDVVEGSEGVGPLAGNELHARYATASGVPIFFDSKKEAGTREAGFGIQLVGTGGVIDLRADREPLAHILKGNPFLPSAEPRAWVPVTSAGIGKPEPIEDIRPRVAGHIGPALDLIAAIGEKRDPLCSAKDGRTVVAMTMATFESHRKGGARVSFPLEVEGNPLGEM